MANGWQVAVPSLIIIYLLIAFIRPTMVSFLSRYTGLSSLLQLTQQQQQPTATTSAYQQSSRLTNTLSFLLAPLLISSPFSTRSRYYLRMVAYVVGLAIGSLTGVIAGLIVPIVRPSWRKNIQWLVARTFYNLVGPVIGWEFIVEGEEYLDPCYRGESHVLVGNHQSMIDILYLGRIFPKTCVVMAKKELKYTPLLGQYMALSRAVFVDRHNRATALETFQKVGADMKKYGLNLFIFPEGTRSNTTQPSLLGFKKGAFHLSIQSQLPIIPIVCENYSSIYRSKISRFERGRPILKVLKPIHPLPGQSPEDLLNLVRDQMLNALVELSQRPGSISSACSGSD
ncbi:hypothetical protein MJO28_014329 [Puccinia striiformis f. sp. tritici]|uniref:1-acyl-sn-glycerol-3-phosphate acyltransferase n=2 Tax=Puccinia striiformis f. sp. tritici TaxID=168172 RepID=A0A0L0W3R1_9BASI|nr:hypothetical protein Pst134EA_026784 [Puccinia striiformis f. sp. tritici]KAI9626473.1 hypothetical protein KEM48_010296 [Puccinia striiformis f. sp. tritici PST-130]KNF06129.1 hypothetical protein PSTG_00639 [Puccinia striiformis f. sp. tritici PST-78]KAH9442997.1 hypothetical protein Pst134EB_027347 [Puccinia striiformis f. sp. tritici]KAH9450074.1 hypothetical protein Pst134EA_026784 [Puccinia striiformis f. sp. tritici]KAI7938750.1 hypothetical protein MJO28_014329 [Puccinia striiformis